MLTEQIEYQLFTPEIARFLKVLLLYLISYYSSGLAGINTGTARQEGLIPEQGRTTAYGRQIRGTRRTAGAFLQ
jgi:hypothetical protein